MTHPNTIVQTRTIGLLLVGGIHHILHLVPVATELEKEVNTHIIVYVKSDEEKTACQNILAGLGAKRTAVEILKPNALARILSPKLSFLFSNLKIWKNLDALIVAERTSTILRYVTKQLPPFIHIPHGAGDGAKSYDRRIRHFDHVLVAGEKDKRRMIELGLVQNENCHVTGYIKPYAVKYINPVSPSVFDNARPVVLYNPHFCEDLSSWREFGFNLLEAFGRNRDMNFIVAPHIRFAKKQDRESIDAIKAYSKYENIHVDLGSAKSCDMTYTRSADIYLGDVSSQVYEFLSVPKACVFLTSAKTQWRDNPDFAHWRYGPVCHSVEAVMAALSRASIDLPDYAQAQTQGCFDATGHPSWNPIELAGEAVNSIMAGHPSGLIFKDNSNQEHHHNKLNTGSQNRCPTY